MHVAALWRYPVKSMRGEALESAQVARDGIVGDRLVHVRGPDGPLTARTQPRLLGLAATLGREGRALVDGEPWDGPSAAAAVRGAAGDEARLAHRDDDDLRFDESPLLVATDGAVADFGHDARRLRPNVVVAGVEGLAERDWAEARLHAGEVSIAVGHLCERCVMTTFEPDTLEQDPDVLRSIRTRYGGRLALNCWVLEPGRVSVGDPVTLIGA